MTALARLALSLPLALATAVALAQPRPAPADDAAVLGPLAEVMTPDAQALDLTLARQAVTEVHAAPYRFTPRARFDSLFAAIEVRCAMARPRRDFVLDVRLAVNALSDGHAALELPSDYLDFYYATEQRLPLELAVIDSGLYLAEAYYADARLHRGAELVSVDGVPARELLLAYAAYGPTRDETIPSTLAAGLRGWRSRLVHALVCGLRQNYRAVVRDSAGATCEAQLLGAGRDELRRQYGTSDGRPLNDLEYRDGDVAYLRIGSFDPGTVKAADGEKVVKQLRGYMDDVVAHAPRALVIDVRGNGGGNEGLANELYGYLSDSNFQVLREVVTEARGKRLDNGVDRPQRVRPFAYGGPLERALMQRRGEDGAYYRKHQS